MGKIGHKKKAKGIVFFEDEIIKKEDAMNILNGLKEQEYKPVKHTTELENISIKRKRDKKKKYLDKIETEILNNSQTEVPGDNDKNDHQKLKVKKKKKLNKEIPITTALHTDSPEAKLEKSKKRKNSQHIEEESTLSTKIKKHKHTRDPDTGQKKKKSIRLHKLENDNNEISSTNSPEENESQENTDSDDSANESEVKEPSSEATNVPQSESKRSIKRKKYAKLIEEKKSKADLKMQQSVLNYLSKWKHARNEWKFEKLKQIWLQQNLFDVNKIPEEFWTITLEYFNGSRGATRKVILAEALKIIDQEDKAEEENDNEDYQTKLRRARDVAQSLEE